jgi:hypothetical protein
MAGCQDYLDDDMEDTEAGRDQPVGGGYDGGVLGDKFKDSESGK